MNGPSIDEKLTHCCNNIITNDAPRRSEELNREPIWTWTFAKGHCEDCLGDFLASDWSTKHTALISGALESQQILKLRDSTRRFRHISMTEDIFEVESRVSLYLFN